ncbi:hypothetical protein KCU85_g455, partial [Aureobasidium melanogenum]
MLHDLCFQKKFHHLSSIGATGQEFDESGVERNVQAPIYQLFDGVEIFRLCQDRIHVQVQSVMYGSLNQFLGGGPLRSNARSVSAKLTWMYRTAPSFQNLTQLVEVVRVELARIESEDSAGKCEAAGRSDHAGGQI